ncbi:MAG: dihydropteroate synthase [Hyphomicrobiaceae bacterium]|nr:dihydropteroate synthase [Hyphomicrobiaceae bacterium]
MTMFAAGLIVIGENFNVTRKIKVTSPRVVREGGRIGIAYTGSGGGRKVLDCTDIVPADPAQQDGFMIPHIAQALRKRELEYIGSVIRAQEKAGAHIIDLCVDEISPYPEERQEWMRWSVKAVQEITGATLAVDSSDSGTIIAGLDAYDHRKSRPAINSFNLEEGREGLVDLARERDALLFVNASGREGMPQSAEERVRNLQQCMRMMDACNIAMADRYLDPLVFPIGTDSECGNHYLQAVKDLRAGYPDVHIFGGHSNVSFGLPRRAALNHAFTLLSIAAGCDAVMVDPVMNSPRPFEEFRYAADALTGKDEYTMKYLGYCRRGQD